MTEGHKHRHVVVPSWDEWYVRALRKPLMHSTDALSVEASRFVYGPCDSPRCKNTHRRPRPDCWTLSLLGILHGLTGLVLEAKGPD